MRLGISRMWIGLLVCLSCLVLSGSAGEKALKPLTLPLEEAAEEVNHSAGVTYDARLPVQGWNYEQTCPRMPVSTFLQEFMIDTSISYAGPHDDQRAMSVAFDGTNYLVVWDDSRTACSPYYYSHIYGARVSQTGELIDSSGIMICSGPFWQECPAVAFDGRNYLVVWDDGRGGIYGARVSQSGAVLDSAGIPICTTGAFEGSPAVAFDGVNYLVVWDDERSLVDYDIYGARVDTSGAVIDSLEIAISEASGDQRSPAVASEGGSCLVVWHADTSVWTDIYGARVDTSGTVLDPSGIPISTAESFQVAPALAFDGTNYLVVWEDWRSETNFDLYGARVSPAGSLLDTSGIAILTSGYHQELPCITFDGANYVVAWSEIRDATNSHVYAARVDTSGVVLDPGGIAVCTLGHVAQYPSVAFGGANSFVVWEDKRSAYDFDVYGARVTQDGTVLDPEGVHVSTAASWQESPYVAFDGTNYLTVWHAYRDSTHYDIFGARVSPLGFSLDTVEITICNAVSDQRFPSAAFDGDNYLVVWEDWRNDSGDIYGARVTPSGTVLDPSGIPLFALNDWQKYPCVAFDGTNNFVVWEDWRGWFPIVPNVFGGRVTPSMEVLDTAGIAICTEVEGQTDPTLAFDGTNYLVVWEDDRVVPGGGSIYGARVSKSGAVLDTSGIAIGEYSWYQQSPSVAFDGTNYLVMWRDERYDMLGARVTQSGIVFDTPRINIDAPDAGVLSVGFDGANYLVVWHDARGESDDIYGARVDTSGAVLDPGGIELVNQQYYRRNPTVTSGGTGQLLLAYEGFAPAPYNSQRVFGGFYTTVGIEEEGQGVNIHHSRAGLFQNRPNPFQEWTLIRYSLPAAGAVTLEVYDIAGRLVESLMSEHQKAGVYQVQWRPKDCANGIYFYRLKAGEFADTRKMTLLR